MLNWNRLLKSSDDEYDSDETYCGDVANETRRQSPEITLLNKLESGQGQYRNGEISHNNAVADQFVANTREDLKVEIGDTEIQPSCSIFLRPESEQSIRDNDCTLPHISIINATRPNEKNETESIREASHNDIEENFDENEIADALESYDFSLSEKYSLPDADLDLFLHDGIILKEFEPCVPPLTLNRPCQRKIPPAEKVLPWVRKRKQKTYMEKKKLPNRKCASYYIEKSSRMLEQSSSCDSSSDVHRVLTDENAEQNRNMFKNQKFESPKECSGRRKRGRPCKSTNGPLTQKEGEKSNKLSITKLKILQDLEEDLSQLKTRLRRPIKTREEAFQMLSHVQSITKSLRFHLDQATGHNKTKSEKYQRKFLLRYLAQQITKSEELERFLDQAIAEADRLTELETSEEAYCLEEPTDHIDEYKTAYLKHDIREEHCNIKTILRSSKSSSESTKNSSESKHITFSDEVEYRYLTSSTQSSNSRESGQYEEQKRASQESETSLADNFSGDYYDVYGKFHGEVKEVSAKNTQILSDSEAEEKGVSQTAVYVAGARSFIHPWKSADLGTQLDSCKNTKIQSATASETIGNKSSLRIHQTELSKTMNPEVTQQNSLNTPLPKPGDRHSCILVRDKSKITNQSSMKLQLCTGGGPPTTISNITKNKSSQKSPDYNFYPENMQLVDNSGHKPTFLVSNAKKDESPDLFGTESNENANLPNIETSNALRFENKVVTESQRKPSASSELFQSENSDILKISRIETNEHFTNTKNKTSVPKNNEDNGVNSGIFLTNKRENLSSPNIQASNDFEFVNGDRVLETNKHINPDFEQMQLENSEHQRETDDAFDFSELQCSTPGPSKWKPVTIMDIKYVRIKDESEFVKLSDLPEGAMDDPDWFDFTWEN